jgi:hypothetical protein
VLLAINLLLPQPSSITLVILNALFSKKKVAEIIDILRSDMRDRPLDVNRLFLPTVTRVTE